MLHCCDPWTHFFVPRTWVLCTGAEFGSPWGSNFEAMGLVLGACGHHILHFGALMDAVAALLSNMGIIFEQRGSARVKNTI